LKDPYFLPQIVAHVGVPTLVEWLGHVGMMGAYSVLDNVLSPLLKLFVTGGLDPRKKFRLRRWMEAWKYGSGNDYKLPETD